MFTTVEIVQVNDGEWRTVKKEPLGSVLVHRPTMRCFDNVPDRVGYCYSVVQDHAGTPVVVPDYGFPKIFSGVRLKPNRLLLIRELVDR